MGLNEEGWLQLRCGNFEKGLDLLRQEYRRSKGPSNTITIGVGEMWTYQYRNVVDHFQTAIQAEPTPSETYYGMIGVAQWCLENTQEAVLAWEKGLRARYSSAFCTHSALLLLLASALSESYPVEAAERNILKKISDVRTKGWSGALARFTVGHIEEQELKRHWTDWVGLNQKQELEHRIWLTEFYRAFRTLRSRQMGVDQFREVARFMTGPQYMELMSDKEFRSLVRNEEFFLARHEGKR